MRKKSDDIEENEQNYQTRVYQTILRGKEENAQVTKRKRRRSFCQEKKAQARRKRERQALLRKSRKSARHKEEERKTSTFGEKQKRCKP
jgi:hypothetical protein